MKTIYKVLKWWCLCNIIIGLFYAGICIRTHDYFYAALLVIVSALNHKCYNIHGKNLQSEEDE